MQFLGKIEAKLDAKARVFVPAVFRKLLVPSGQSEFVLRKDLFQNCLTLYPKATWDRELASLRANLNRWVKLEQQLFRQFIVDAEIIEMDASGRILLPKRLMHMISLESEVVFLGLDDIIEIWKNESLEASLLPIDDFSEQLEMKMNKKKNND